MYVKKDGTALLVGKAKTVSDMSQGVGIIDGSCLWTQRVPATPN